MGLKTQMPTDMEDTFLNTDEFADSIVFTTKAGIASTIPALIDRTPINAKGEDQGRILQKQAEITIHNDVDNGVISIDTKGDKVAFPALPGGDSVDWDVIQILDSSEAHWHLLVSQ
jgi:hypothetical protein